MVSDLLITLPTLLVRSEFCEKVVEVGGLNILKDLMVTFYDNDVSDNSSFFSLHLFLHVKFSETLPPLLQPAEIAGRQRPVQGEDNRTRTGPGYSIDVIKT